MIRALRFLGTLSAAFSVIGIAATGRLTAQRSSSLASGSSQKPRLSNAHIVTASGSGDLTAIVRDIVRRREAAGWVGWAAPGVASNHRMCCGGDDESWRANDGCCGCSLDSDKEGTRTPHSRRAVELEPTESVFVFVRAEHGAIQKVRMFSEDCDIDGGGLTVDWLLDARPAASVVFLQSLVAPEARRTESDGRDSNLGQQALAAIAMHAGSEAEHALVQLLEPQQSMEIRKQVTFWLGSVRGRFGFDQLDHLLDTDRSDAIRDAATFGLFVSHEPAAVGRLIETAKTDSSGRVRGQALFWLAQKASARAQAAITEAIVHDPETEVKKKAVFALAQLPGDEGVPLLIRVARTSPNPVVRKQAMFWLGQSHDARAVAFFANKYSAEPGCGPGALQRPPAVEYVRPPDTVGGISRDVRCVSSGDGDL